MSDTTARIDAEGLTIHIPDIGEALKAMSLTDKQWVMAYMACADDLFDKVVQLMADGFCTPNEDDWRWWYPADVDKARAILDSRLDDVAQRRIADLERDLEREKHERKIERRWRDAYKWAFTEYLRGGRFGGDEESRVHQAALKLVQEAEAREQVSPCGHS